MEGSIAAVVEPVCVGEGVERACRLLFLTIEDVS
jgi:hypothetical protein